MLFNSYIFIFLFLPVVLLGWYVLNNGRQYRLANLFLAGMSLWFYGYFNVYYLAIILSSIGLNYALSFLLTLIREDSAHRNLWNRVGLVFGVFLNLGILFYFKYYDFFVENINYVFHTDYTLKHILLPLGISFFTFQQLSFVIDRCLGKTEHYSLLNYLTFVTFFPQLIAGPIVLYKEMIPQFEDHTRRRFDVSSFSRGIYLFVLGLSKKVLLADTFALAANYGFAQTFSLDSISTVAVVLSYTFELYFDFSGYSDMAIGLGKMFNIELPINFNAPYRSCSIKEFWQRWHITLGVWFKDYVMYPMQKSKHMVQLGKRARKRLGKKTGRKLPFYLSMVVLWFLIGIWHGGTGYYFMASAVIPFFLLMGGDLLQPVFEKLKKLLKIRKEGWIFRLFQRARTLLLICVCWVFVCAAGTAEGFAALGQALTHPFRVHIGQIIGAENLGRKTLVIFGLTILLGAIEYILQERGTSIKEFLDRRRYGVRVAVLYAELLLILLVGMVGNSAFIYFQF